MKVALCCLSLFLAVYAAPQDIYQTRNSINVADILKSERLLTNYYNCLMDKGTCTPAGQDLKRYLPDALRTKCKRCSVKQKNDVLMTVKFLSEKKPAMWKALEEKYDPDGKLRAAAVNDPELKKYNLRF